MTNKLNNERKSTALIVDDNFKMRAAIQKILRAQLKNKITRIIECENGKDAAELYFQHKPEWTIMDIKMPVMDGLEASKTILKSYPEAKIIILTQYDDPEYYELAQKIGIKAFVLKENLSDISTLIRNMG
ncbi:MAG: response regulator transcription factor [Ignavibacteriaceae bacterium]